MSDCCHHDCCRKEQPAPSPVEIPEGAMAWTFRVRGMDCPDEIAAIEREMKAVPRVLGVTANLMASTVTIHTDGEVERGELVRAINRSGVTVESGEAEKRRRNSLPAWLVTLSGLGTGLGIALQWAGLRETLWPDAAFSHRHRERRCARSAQGPAGGAFPVARHECAHDRGRGRRGVHRRACGGSGGGVSVFPLRVAGVMERGARTPGDPRADGASPGDGAGETRR